MPPEVKKARIDHLWNMARRYNNKLRFQARLQKMTESNLKEMMIDDINDDKEEDNTQTDNQPKIPWYLIDKERNFCRVWDFMITLLTIYTLFVTPFVVVFPTVYEWCELNGDELDVSACDEGQGTKGKSDILFKIELIFDIIYFVFEKVNKCKCLTTKQ